MHLPSFTLCSTLDNLPATAETLLRHAGGTKVWLLEGAMGAGKTTVIRALCARLGVLDNVTSPTFSLVHEYAMVSGEAVYHFDFYRTCREEEALDLDCMTYFESGSYCFVEWPNKVANLIPPAHCKVRLAVQPDGSRIFYFQLDEDNPLAYKERLTT
ncbi:MAG: tRNA (adenosine(37)-N6)-threonylcarbamoyltransferase complex ATPase subunit type 1 TsaE [Amoebophilaceae bacterium]|jgi:tRNA threonylcarbamoyladenosine biosynthesis protein TsaE|nr:tRNA (adenosine(37)-N6)-threonylcarbamoyltransferase complex ATPase subunit type 1 TsaE [Amoebophilaceae bacterium]